MGDKSIVGEVLHGGAFLLAATSVVLAGWNEPLRYVFMKPEEIITEEQAMLAQNTDSNASPGEWRPGGTSLDRAPYRRIDGELRYSKDFDYSQLGTYTESKGRKNTRGSKQ
jgi:hypothetical protein